MASDARRLVPLEIVMTRVRSSAEAKALLDVLLSPHELANLRNRWFAFQMLLDGATQRSIRDELGVSITTASRAARTIGPGEKVIRGLIKRKDG